MKNKSIQEIRVLCSPIQNEIINLYLDRVKQKDICSKLNTTRGVIDTLVKKYNLVRFRDRKNYCCKNINIKDPNFWYFLGLFASDGNLYKCSGTDVIQLQLDDREAIEDVKRILGFTGTIKSYYKINKMRYYLKISDSNLIKTVRKIFNSDCYNKTKTIKFPKITSENNLKMFLRGFIDGDGCFSKYKRTPNYYHFGIYCASFDFFSSLLENIKKITDKVHTYNNNTIRIDSKNSMYKFCKYLYSINIEIGIKRKRNIALQHIKNYELKI